MLIATKRSRSGPVDTAIHDAIRTCYEGLFTQAQLADATGIAQQTISKWTRGASTPNPYEIAAIERACDAEAERRGDRARRRPLGWVGRQAGLISDVVTVVDAISAAPELDDDGRESLLRAYDGAVDATRFHRMRLNDAGDDGEVRL